MINNYCYKMDNQKCVLVKFMNTESTIGYISWLGDEDKKNIDTIISEKKEIIINWPDCDVTSAVIFMLKRLEKATFKKHVVQILEHGSKWSNN